MLRHLLIGLSRSSSAGISGWGLPAVCSHRHARHPEESGWPAAAAMMHAEAAPAENEEEEVREVGTPRVKALAEEILQLNLLEIADLTTILKKRLNLKDTPMFGAMPMAGMQMPQQQQQQQQTTGADEKEEEKKEEEEQKEFNLKLEGFDPASKVKVIKEIRGMTELGLMQAKQLVDKAPTLVKSKLDKKTAEELKAKLEAVGGKVVLE